MSDNSKTWAVELTPITTENILAQYIIAYRNKNKPHKSSNNILLNMYRLPLEMVNLEIDFYKYKQKQLFDSYQIIKEACSNGSNAPCVKIYGLSHYPRGRILTYTSVSIDEVKDNLFNGNEDLTKFFIERLEYYNEMTTPELFEVYLTNPNGSYANTELADCITLDKIAALDCDNPITILNPNLVNKEDIINTINSTSQVTSPVAKVTEIDNSGISIEFGDITKSLKLSDLYAELAKKESNLKTLQELTDLNKFLEWIILDNSSFKTELLTRLKKTYQDYITYDINHLNGSIRGLSDKN